MRRITLAVLGIAVSLCLAGSAFAAGATKDECVAKSKESAAMVNEKGIGRGHRGDQQEGREVRVEGHLRLPDGPRREDACASDESGADREEPARDEGQGGSPGKLLFKEFVEVAKGKGEGWVDYMWTNPGDPKPRKKVTYIYRVPGKDLFVGAGIYE